MAPPADPTSTTKGDVVYGDEPGGDRIIRRRRLLHLFTSAALTTILGLAVIGATGIADIYGVDTTWVSAEGGGYRLRVRYATVSRSGLATPFEIVVERPQGFAVPVTVGVDHDYLMMWDENGRNPSPSSETTFGPWLLWEFDPPSGDHLSFSYDARIEPGVQWGKAGRVAVFEDDAPVVQVDFSTRVMP